MNPPRIVVVVLGGNVQCVLASDANVEVSILDYDNDPRHGAPSRAKFPHRLPMNALAARDVAAPMDAE